MNSLLKPSDFNEFPYSSVVGDADPERTALDIIQLLIATGDAWRRVRWTEFVQYYAESLRPYHERDKWRFDEAVEYCTSAEAARTFSPAWEHLASHTYTYARWALEDDAR